MIDGSGKQCELIFMQCRLPDDRDSLQLNPIV